MSNFFMYFWVVCFFLFRSVCLLDCPICWLGFLLSWFYAVWVLYIFSCSFSVRRVAGKYFLPFCSLPLHTVSLFVQKLFDAIPLVNTWYDCLSLRVPIGKSSPTPVYQHGPSHLLHRYTVPGLLPRSLLHFELPHVQGDRYTSGFILLHVQIQFPRSRC